MNYLRDDEIYTSNKIWNLKIVKCWENRVEKWKIKKKLKNQKTNVSESQKNWRIEKLESQSIGENWTLERSSSEKEKETQYNYIAATTTQGANFSAIMRV